MAPGWLVALVWPPLKLAALAADVTSIRSGRPGLSRSRYLALRGADWSLFALIGVVAPRTRSAAVVSALTLAQAASTAEAIRRLAPEQPVAARLLVPQLGWLLYASAVPPIAAWRAARASARWRMPIHDVLSNQTPGSNGLNDRLVVSRRRLPQARRETERTSVADPELTANERAPGFPKGIGASILSRASDPRKAGANGSPDGTFSRATAADPVT